jgi:hypothetical protein
VAVDTRNKRASIIGYALPMGVFPNPDGTIDQADRQQIAFLYPGILAAELALASGLVTATITLRQPEPTLTLRQPEPVIVLEDGT